MVWKEAYYEEPTDGCCSECGESDIESSICGADLSYSGNYFCDEDNSKHLCSECKEKIDNLNKNKKKKKVVK